MSTILQDFDASLQKLKTFNKKIISKTTNIDDFQREVFEGLNEIDTKINILQGLIKDLKLQVIAHKKEIHENTDLQSKHESSIAENTRNIDDLREQISKLQEEKQTLTKQIQQLSDENASLKKTNSDNITSHQDLNTRLLACQKRFQDLNKVKGDTDKQNKLEKDRLEEQIQTLTAELEAMKQGKTQEAEQLEKQRIEQQEQHQKEIQTQLEASRNELQGLNTRNANIELELKKLVNDNKELQRKNQELTQTNAELLNKIGEAIQIINAATQNIEQLSKIDMTSAKPKISKINKTLTEMIQQMDPEYSSSSSSDEPREEDTDFAKSMAELRESTNKGIQGINTVRAKQIQDEHILQLQQQQYERERAQEEDQKQEKGGKRKTRKTKKIRKQKGGFVYNTNTKRHIRHHKILNKYLTRSSKTPLSSRSRRSKTSSSRSQQSRSSN